MRNHHVLLSLSLSLLALAAPLPHPAQAAPAEITAPSIRFVVIDPQTRQPIPGAYLLIALAPTQTAQADPSPVAVTLRTGTTGSPTPAFDAARWATEAATSAADVRIVTVPLGATIVLAQRGKLADSAGKVPVRDIYIKVTATRLPLRSGDTGTGTTRTNQQLSTFTNKAGNDAGSLTRGQSGVASDSNGQQHVRGEHADISFVIDGVPLPDTLSGRQGSVVVPSTIQSLDILTGGFAPEFGGQTAAVLDVQTLPGARKLKAEVNQQGGTYSSFNSDLTVSGPAGRSASYVIDVSNDRSSNAIEPQQPDQQTAHNSGQDQSYFGKFRVLPRLGDSFTVTLSHAPSRLDLSNRTGLGSRFALAGQGFGFLGARNADGTRPDATADNAAALGAETIPLHSQQDDGMAITQNEINEFATVAYTHALSARDTANIAGVVLHSGQNLKNSNPAVDLSNLPVDNSVEYNPTAKRDVYHYQVTGDFAARRGAHRFKTGFLSDQQSGDESYQLVPASRLALDELVALAPGFAPAGDVQTAKDINNNPVFVAGANPSSPTVKVHRSGYYRAAYLQDTWQLTKTLAANYGVRYDAFEQKQNLGQPPVSKSEFSPRLNLSLGSARSTILRLSFGHLFNIPPLAQGAVVGQPIQPETLNQYDASVEHQVTHGQSAKIAYYYKQIKNQVDTGLLIPGSQIGLYSAVNFQYGGVHGIEVSYDIAPPSGVGFDGYVNYSYSIAKPNGVDNTGAKVPLYNDHDQRHTLGVGLAYLVRGGASAAFTLNYGSGLASSPIPPSMSRIARTQVDLHITSGSKLFHGRGGFGLDVSNLFDSREVINFQSAFSGTRFQQGRRVLGSIFATF